MGISSSESPPAPEFVIYALLAVMWIWAALLAGVILYYVGLFVLNLLLAVIFLPYRIVHKIESAAGGSVDGVTVAVWGLTFKARTDDMRESPSLAIIEVLLQRGAQVRAYDPTVTSPLSGISICADAYAACEGAAVLAVLTEWDEFRWLDIDKVASAMSGRAIVDGRNLLDHNAWRQAHFTVAGIGR